MGKVKNWLIKKAAKKKGISESQVDTAMGMMDKNPDLFKKIEKEIKEKKKQGMGEMQARMQVMMKYKKEIQALQGGPQQKFRP